MVDPVFKAPLPPPQMNDSDVSQDATPTAVSPEQESVVSVSDAARSEQSDKKQQITQRLGELKAQMVHYFWYSTVGLFLLGAFMGCAMSGSDSTPRQTQTQPVAGISARVITNGDIKGKLHICGSVLATQACLYYVLNNTGHDRLAKDFFDDVSSRTQRSVFNIKMVNPLYSERLIKPGYFAEIIVPASN